MDAAYAVEVIWYCQSRFVIVCVSGSTHISLWIGRDFPASISLMALVAVTTWNNIFAIMLNGSGGGGACSVVHCGSSDDCEHASGTTVA